MQTSALFLTLTSSVLGLAVVGVGEAADNNPVAPSPPAYTFLRYDEDYSYLSDPAARTDVFDPIKYILLSERSDLYLTFGGQLRDRYEYFDNYLFGSGPQDRNGYNLLRLMANADLHLGCLLYTSDAADE